LRVVIELLGFAEVVVRLLLMSFLAVIKWPEKGSKAESLLKEVKWLEKRMEKGCQGEGGRKGRWRMAGFDEWARLLSVAGRFDWW